MCSKTAVIRLDWSFNYNKLQSYASSFLVCSMLFSFSRIDKEDGQIYIENRILRKFKMV